MMGNVPNTVVCVAMLVVVIAQATAEVGGSLRVLDGTFRPTPPPPLPPGGEVITDSNGKKWEIKGHTYRLLNPSEVEQTWPRPIARHNTGKKWDAYIGSATQEGQRRFFEKISDGVEEAEGMVDEQLDGIPMKNSPDYDTEPQVPSDESVSWSRESGMWRYKEGVWREVHLPDIAYPSLPVPPPPAAALVVASVGKVEIKRQLAGLKNVTLYCRFYLSDSQHPDLLPELEVYFVVDGSRTRLETETTRGVWEEQVIALPDADNSSIIIEGWLKAEEDIVAVSNVYITGVTQISYEALDIDADQTSLADNTTKNATSTPDAEGKWTDVADQDNTTLFRFTPDSQSNYSDGDADEGIKTTIPTDRSELEASTDTPEGMSQSTEQFSGSADVTALNSSMSGEANLTSTGSALSDLNDTITTTDAEHNEADGDETSTTSAVMDVALSTPENGTEDASETSAKESITTTTNTTDLSIPGITTGTLQTNASVSLPLDNATVPGSPFITPETAVTSERPSSTSTDTRFTDEYDPSTNVIGTDGTSVDTPYGMPELNVTLGNITGEETIFPWDGMMESTSPSAGNSTEAVVAVPVPSTSWHVFQIFLVLCVIGLLALGFLYWKKKRRQDDEIPVFTRHTDYHNPTFTMEDAANFMSRVGRNTYKTID